MKRTIAIVLAVLGMATAQAQRFEPNTKWPYLYEEFQPGTIFLDGKQKSETQLNVHLMGNVLHFVAPDGRIMESRENNVVRVDIGSDSYVYNGARLMQIVAAQADGMLLKLVRGDFDAMQSGGGAYGASLNSSASRDLSSLDLGGVGNPELGKLLQERGEGRLIPLVTEYYLMIDTGQGMQQTRADKTLVGKLVPEARQAEWKQFLKANKIKWKNEESLKLVLQFFSAAVSVAP